MVMEAATHKFTTKKDDLVVASTKYGQIKFFPSKKREGLWEVDMEDHDVEKGVSAAVKAVADFVQRGLGHIYLSQGDPITKDQLSGALPKGYYVVKHQGGFKTTGG